MESIKNQYSSASTDVWTVMVLIDLCPLKPAEALLHTFTSEWLSVRVMNA